MSRFRKVDAGTWADERFRGLTEQAQRLWFYLLTGPEVTSLPGLIVIGRAGLAEALGWSIGKLDRCFAELARSVNEDGVPMAKADWKARLVWLPKGHKHNSPANPNVISGWKNLWRAVPECSLKHEALIVLREFVLTLPESFRDEFAKSVDRYDSVRGRSSSQVVDSLTDSSRTVSPDLPPDLHSTLSKDSTEDLTRTRARARTATATVTASLGREDRPDRSGGASDSGGPPQESSSLVRHGSASGATACDEYITALHEAGQPRGPLRAAWERQALCDAINTHMPDAATPREAIDAMRAAVADWINDVRGRGKEEFTTGWGPRKFADWLATRPQRPRPRTLRAASDIGVEYEQPTPEQKARLEQSIADLLNGATPQCSAGSVPVDDVRTPEELAAIEAQRIAALEWVRSRGSP